MTPLRGCAAVAATRDGGRRRHRRPGGRAGWRRAASRCWCSNAAPARRQDCARSRSAARRMDAGPDRVHDALGVRGTVQRSGRQAWTEHLTLQPRRCDLARHAWERRHARPVRRRTGALADAIGDFAGAGRGARLPAASADARATSTARWSGRSCAAPANAVCRLRARAGWRTACRDLARISPFATLWRALGQHFTDPRLRQLFGRYATYCGSSPFSRAGHADAGGACGAGRRVAGRRRHAPDGGSGRLAAQRGAANPPGCRSCGCNGAGWAQACVRMQATGARRVRLRNRADAMHSAADAVVFNGDAAALAAGLLGTARAGHAATGAPGRGARCRR